jgi:hypothetical protein
MLLEKSLKLTSDVRNEIGSGKIANLLAVDCVRIENIWCIKSFYM